MVTPSRRFTGQQRGVALVGIRGIPTRSEWREIVAPKRRWSISSPATARIIDTSRRDPK